MFSGGIIALAEAQFLKVGVDRNGGPRPGSVARIGHELAFFDIAVERRDFLVGVGMRVRAEMGNSVLNFYSIRITGDAGDPLFEIDVAENRLGGPSAFIIRVPFHT